MTQCNHTTNQRTFKHLSAIQRGKLFQMVQEKKYTQTQMAQMLGVNQSTISRELKRGRVQQKIPIGSIILFICRIMHKSDINKIDRSVELLPVSESMILSFGRNSPLS